MADFVRRKIQPKTLGDTLKAARKRKNVTFTQIEEETKVRAKYLMAFEEGRYDELPGSVYAVGFLSKYSDFLDLKKSDLIRQFKMELGESNYLGRLAPERRIKEPWFSVTPKTLIVAGITLALILVLGYIVYSVREFTLPPNLVIASPSSEQVLKERTVAIIGKTDAGSVLTINNQSVLLDDNGNFTEVVKLNPGLNVFEVKSSNRNKKITVQQLKILAEF